jgi:hypothetical protein
MGQDQSAEIVQPVAPQGFINPEVKSANLAGPSKQ